MSATDELDALITSIGEYTVDTLGRDSLDALTVRLDPRDMSAFMTISLRDRSDVAQKAAIALLFDVERIYIEEVALTYVFSDETIVDELADAERVPQFSLA